MTTPIYNHKDTELKWTNIWQKTNLYKTPLIKKGDQKKYILETFPYPSADGLHTGHPVGYTASDISARFARANNYKVLYPMGWDAFGLPTENFAKKKGLHPQSVTNKSIANFKSQVMRLGASYDWGKEINTSDPNYYKWTQWFFQLLYKRGLAYKKEALVNWDPIDKTVLANEQVLSDGTAERSGAIVEQKMMNQWFFKITDYAERLLNDLDDLDWPESTKQMQRNWIGKSVGAEVEFAVAQTNSQKTLAIMVHGGTSLGDRLDDQINIRAISKNQYSTNKNEPVWSENLEQFISDPQIKFINPLFPNAINANYTEWERFFEQVLKQEITENVNQNYTDIILIGHSLGTVFLQQYLTTNNLSNKFNLKVQSVHLAGCCTKEGDFQINNNWKSIESQSNNIHLYHSEDDSVCNYSEAKLYHKHLPSAKLHTFKDRGHLLQHELPELVENILKPENKITVFTTAYDTIFGVTFLVIAPEHLLVSQLTTQENQTLVSEYINQSKTKSNLERTDLNKNKQGVFTGSFAVHPLTGDQIPIWIADYVITNYGTGAVMAVPGEDERDYEFATKYSLPIVYTNHTNQFVSYSKEIKPNKKLYTLINSGAFSGMNFEDGRVAILNELIRTNAGKAITNYRLRDWSIGRQRYWGCPIPVMYNKSPSPQPSPIREGGSENKFRLSTLNNSSSFIARARELRTKQTPTEEIFWEILRNRNFLNLKFRRQQPFEKYIADFYCHELKLIIELDGKSHNQKEEYDTHRTSELSGLGIEVIRINDLDVKNSLENTLKVLENKVKVLIAKNTPSLAGEGWGEAISNTLLIDAINCLVTKQGEELSLNSELFEYLKTLPNKKIVVTNAKNEILIKIKELLKDSDFEVFSLEFDPEKTNPEYYRILKEKLNLDLSKTFYFDHSVDNLESAKQIGFESVQFLNNNQIINILEDQKQGLKLIPVIDLPLVLPQDLDLSTGMIKPLSQNQEFINSASLKYGENVQYEGDTMDTFVCSSWYFFRYCSGNIENSFANLEDLKTWMPVDQYIIGAEHSTMHLLYARFFTKILFDAGLISFTEPFAKMRHQGLLLGTDNNKMSKSKGNVVNPDDIFNQYGADTLRMYLMFMGPFDQPKPWNTNSIKGVRRFIDRVWKMQNLVVINPESTWGPKKEMLIEIPLNNLIKKIGEDIESYSFNTCVSEFMKFVNTVDEVGGVLKDQYDRFLVILAPFAPFITEEIWSQTNPNSIHTEQWPKVKTFGVMPGFMSETKIMIQINGKIRGEFLITLESNKSEDEIITQAKEVAQKWLADKVIKFIKVVPNKLVSIVVE